MQANNQSAKVELNDGRTIELRYEFNCLCDAEEQTGVNLLVAQDNLMDGSITCKEFRALLFAMIVPFEGFPTGEKEQLTMCGEFVNLRSRGALIEGMGMALALAVSAEYAEEFRKKVMDAPKVMETPLAAIVEDVTAEAKTDA